MNVSHVLKTNSFKIKLVLKLVKQENSLILSLEPVINALKPAVLVSMPLQMDAQAVMNPNSLMKINVLIIVVLENSVLPHLLDNAKLVLLHALHAKEPLLINALVAKMASPLLPNHVSHAEAQLINMMNLLIN